MSQYVNIYQFPVKWYLRLNNFVIKAVIPAKPDQWVELKSPFVGYKTTTPIQVVPTNRANSRFSSKMRSRPTTAIEGIEEIDEKIDLENLNSDSINDFLRDGQNENEVV